MMTATTVQLNSKGNGLIPLENDTLPGSIKEQISSGSLSKTAYVDFAKRIDNHMDANNQAPSYGVIGLGKVSYQSQIYLYSRVLTSYGTNKSLPKSVYVKTWNRTNIPITSKNSGFTPGQIISAAIKVKNYLSVTKKLPDTIIIGTTTVNQAQFLHLITTATIQIKANDFSLIALKNDTLPSYSQDNIVTGTTSQAEYLDFAQRIKEHMDINGQAPAYGLIGLGKISYQNMIFMYSRILAGYSINGFLPSRIANIPWVKINPYSSYRPVYITSDNITDAGTVDINRINTIVNGLKAMGLKAVNFGLGPNTHIKVLTDTNVPQNALVIDIYGGACAGTLYEMGTKWYKSIKGTREVFTVFIPPAKDINGLDFLPRAHDDNFSPASFTGIANPDQYLINNGYNFLRSGDYSAIINAILLEAKN
jgi:hypothetical protein